MSPVGWGQQAVYLQSGDPENENTPTLQYPGLLGARFVVVQPNRSAPGAEAGRSKTYQLVKTDSTMTVAPFLGAVAWWSDKTQYLVTTTVTTLGRGRVAGVFQNAISLGNYGCIQKGGPATVKFVDAPTANPTAAGLFVIPSATNAKADCLAAGSAPTYPILGVSAGVYDAANAQGVVDLDCDLTTT
jgi:hypothetical protein